MEDIGWKRPQLAKGLGVSFDEAFVKRLQEAGHGSTTTYYENIEGGHGGAADPKQAAFMACLQYNFLLQTIGTSLKKE